jgi:hypothetical protein
LYGQPTKQERGRIYLVLTAKKFRSFALLLTFFRETARIDFPEKNFSEIQILLNAIRVHTSRALYNNRTNLSCYLQEMERNQGTASPRLSLGPMARRRPRGKS